LGILNALVVKFRKSGSGFVRGKKMMIDEEGREKMEIAVALKGQQLLGPVPGNASFRKHANKQAGVT
jgi:hypothetical protein